jgi:hypothetical protein
MELRVPGYMVPLADNLEEVTEFLLVPYPGACIHVPPPPPNQIVHVIMEGNKKTHVRLWMEAVWVEGTLRHAEATTRDGALSFFQLTSTLIQSYAAFWVIHPHPIVEHDRLPLRAGRHRGRAADRICPRPAGLS